jgi:hypothetical protein
VGIFAGQCQAGPLGVKKTVAAKGGQSVQIGGSGGLQRSQISKPFISPVPETVKQDEHNIGTHIGKTSMDFQRRISISYYLFRKYLIEKIYAGDTNSAQFSI